MLLKQATYIRGDRSATDWAATIRATLLDHAAQIYRPVHDAAHIEFSIPGDPVILRDGLHVRDPLRVVIYQNIRFAGLVPQFLDISSPSPDIANLAISQVSLGARTAALCSA